MERIGRERMARRTAAALLLETDVRTNDSRRGLNFRSPRLSFAHPLFPPKAAVNLRSG